MPDKRVHQLGFNAERAGCNESHQVHQWFTPSTTMCNLDDDWLELLCSANRKLPSWQAETRARGKRADCDIQRHSLPLDRNLRRSSQLARGKAITRPLSDVGTLPLRGGCMISPLRRSKTVRRGQ